MTDSSPAVKGLCGYPPAGSRPAASLVSTIADPSRREPAAPEIPRTRTQAAIVRKFRATSKFSALYVLILIGIV
jgi:hypothetical protein